MQWRVEDDDGAVRVHCSPEKTRTEATVRACSAQTDDAGVLVGEWRRYGGGELENGARIGT